MEYFNKHLKNLLILDIETVSAEKDFEKINPELQHLWSRKASFLRNEGELNDAELYFDRAAIYAEFGKIIVIAAGIYHQSGEDLNLRVTSFSNNNEKTLLVEFKDFLTSRFDPTTLQLCAHNGKEFDYPYLSRRMLINGISLPSVLDLSGKKPWEVQHLDTMEMWKFGDRKHYTSLDLLTNIFNIPTSKQELDGSQVNRTYYQEKEGLQRIEKYCRADVVATAQLYLALQNKELIKEDNIKHI
jgi:hypothetical protein